VLADSLLRLDGALEALVAALEHPEEHCRHLLVLEPTEAAPSWWAEKLAGCYRSRTAALLACRQAAVDSPALAPHRRGLYRYAIRAAA
jgi:hypothetical protein